MNEPNGIKPIRGATRRYPRQPLFDILREQGRMMTWLARKTGYSHQHIHNVSGGRFPASAEFRRRCANVMGLPESVLFITSAPAASVSGGDRAAIGATA